MTFHNMILSRRLDLAATASGDPTNEDDTPIFDAIVLDWENIREYNKARYHEGFLNGYSANWVYHTPDPEHDHPEYVEGFNHGRANAENDEQWAEMQRDQEMLEEWGMLR